MSDIAGRLRDPARGWHPDQVEAADLIEQQAATIAQLRAALDSLQALLYPVAAQVPIADECLGIINRFHGGAHSAQQEEAKP